MFKSVRSIQVVAMVFTAGAFVASPALADEGCLNLQAIGESALKIQNLEVRTDIVDIQGLEAGPRSTGSVGMHLRDAQSPDLNNYFFSFKNDSLHKRIPSQGGCAPGSVVRIPESSHYQYFTIVEATQDALTLRSMHDGNTSVIRKVGDQRLLLVNEVFDTEQNAVCNPNAEKSKVIYTGYVTWGSAGTVEAASPSEHMLELLAQFGSSDSLTECMKRQ
jgi:hypothetical protein